MPLRKAYRKPREPRKPWARAWQGVDLQAAELEVLRQEAIKALDAAIKLKEKLKKEIQQNYLYRTGKRWPNYKRTYANKG